MRVLFRPVSAQEGSSKPVKPTLREELKQTKTRHELLSTVELQSIAKIEASLLKGARGYFEDNGFVEVVVPHITKATGACENVGTMFALDYFGEQGYLSQTAQLYLETLTPFLKKVWCIGPSFRAEPRADNRHLSEFTLIELEFAGDLSQLMKHIENMICSMIQRVLEERKEELTLLNVEEKRLLDVRSPFEKITYTSAVKDLAGYEVEWGDDLKSHHENFLVKIHGDKPLFITHYPKEIKFFNMKTNPENPGIVNSTDLILPFSGEAVGAAEREFDYTALHEKLASSTMLKQLKERGGSIEDFSWYLEFYKKHGIPHAGCGIGLNRVTQFVLGIDDIRATTVFPLNRDSLI